MNGIFVGTSITKQDFICKNKRHSEKSPNSCFFLWTFSNVIVGNVQMRQKQRRLIEAKYQKHQLQNYRNYKITKNEPLHSDDKKRCGFLLKPLTDEGLLNPVTSHFSFFKCIHLHHNASMLIRLSRRQFPAQSSSPFGSLERDPAPSVILAGRIPHHQRLDSIGAMDPSISLQGLKL